ncbi:MAG: FadR/GntR family transcriptional regulator [Granulosicoccaceae bacterium]
MNETHYYDLKQNAGPTPSLSSEVAAAIGRDIVARVHLPGSLIEDEARLATRFNVSRSVIRDAVKVLVGKGLLEVRRGIGTRVQPRSRWGLLDDDVMAWTQAAPASAQTLRQLMEIRQMIEPKAARWAAERAEQISIDAIEAALTAMEVETGEVMDFVAADAQFHRAVLHASNNEFLSALEGVIFSAMLSSIRLTNADPRDNTDSIPFHREVFEAISRHQPDAAEAAMLTLLHDTVDRLDKRTGS